MNRDVMEDAMCFAKMYAKECCREIVEWKKTGLLRNGRLRELANIYKSIDKHRHMEMAERTIETIAIEAMAEQ